MVQRRNNTRGRSPDPPNFEMGQELKRDTLRQLVYEIAVGKPISANLEAMSPGLLDRAKLIWEELDLSQRVLRAEATAVSYDIMTDATVEARVRLSAANSVIANAEQSFANRRKWEALNDPHTRRAAIEEFTAPSDELLDVIQEAWVKNGRVPARFRQLLAQLEGRGVL